jgi:hypothetical protein
VPADWSWFSVQHVPLGPVALNLNYQRSAGHIRLEVGSSGKGDCSLEFSPAVSLRARITSVRLNGRPLRFHLESNSSDQHVSMRVPVTGPGNTIEIQMKNDFELSQESTLPELGGASHGLRVLAESWTPARDTLTVRLSGAPGESYELSAWNPSQISSIEGAEMKDKSGPEAKVQLRLPSSAAGTDPEATIVFHFAAR